MYCLWCMEEMQTMLNWSNFLTLMKSNGLCDTCKVDLQILAGARCKKCSRETELEICSDCIWWEEQRLGDPLIKNYSVFHYNSFMQEVIAKWKYRGDFALGEIFRSYVYANFKHEFQSLAKEALVMPIPLSSERLLERGFNQAEVIASFLPIQKAALLIREHGEKQSKMNRIERIRTKNPFSLQGTIKKPVILVDDIYTTGTTLRHAATHLKENGCPGVYAYTLIRG